MVDAYRLSFKPHEMPEFPNSGKPARIAEQSGYLDDASAVRLLGPKVELAYDRTSGELFRALADREMVMTFGPKLHMQKSKAPTTEYPDGHVREDRRRLMVPRTCPAIRYGISPARTARRKATRPSSTGRGTTARISSGGFEIRMDDAGDAEFRYEFTYKAPRCWVREIGLDFELPLSFDKLSWDRNAEYSYYPADHIGRPLGEAVAHPAVPQTVPARRPALRAGRSSVGQQRFPQHETTHLHGQPDEQGRPGRRDHLRRHAARPRDRGHARDPPQGARLLRRHVLDLSRTVTTTVPAG